MTEHTHKILIVEDEAVMLQPISMALSASGYTIHQAKDGLEAITQYQNVKPDLILLDIGLPKKNGVEVLENIRHHFKDKKTHIIMLTAAGEKKAVIECIRYGITDYILKTQFDLSNLLSRIQKALTPPNTESQKDTSSEAPIDNTKQIAPKLSLIDLERKVSIKQIRDLIKRYKHQCFSDTALDILEMCKDRNCKINDLCKIVRTDHSIATAIMKLANSAAFRRRGRAQSLNKAVIRIGFNGVRSIVMSMSMINRDEQEMVPGYLSTNHFWEHCFGVGLLCSEIAKQLKFSKEDADTLFSIGLMHDIGKMILADAFKEEMAEIAQFHNRTSIPICDIERKILSIDHTHFGSDLMRYVGFDSTWINVIERHHECFEQILKSSETSRHLLLVIQLADRILNALKPLHSLNATLENIDQHIKALHLNEKQLCESIDVTLQSLMDISFMYATGTSKTKETELNQLWTHYKIDHELPCENIMSHYFNTISKDDGYPIKFIQLKSEKTDSLDDTIANIDHDLIAGNYRGIIAEASAVYGTGSISGVPILLFNKPLNVDLLNNQLEQLILG